MLIQTRAQLAAMVHTTYRDNLTKGSDAWRAHQAAKRALDQFDLAHPSVVVELYEQFNPSKITIVVFEDASILSLI